MSGKRMHIAWFSGHGVGPGQSTWSDDRLPASLRWDRPDAYVEMTRVMDRSGVDFLVFADTLGIPDLYRGSIDPYLEYAIAMPKMDPAILAPILAATTSSIGIVPTLTTTFYPPYLLARLLATLDHVTGGRIGWNIVTGGIERGAQNFGLAAMPAHDSRYDMADEYVELCEKLWASWEPGAVIEDPVTGVFADPGKVHTVDHAGEHYACRGPLNVVPSPQGRPFLVQAGSSPRGIEFAGRHADAVITNKNTIEDMRAFRERIRASAVAAGREPDAVKVFFIVSPVLAESPDALQVEHSAGAPARLQMGLAQLSAAFGTDLSLLPLDEPVTGHGFGRNTIMEQFVSDGGEVPTLRQVAERMGSWVSMPFEGSADEIADRMEYVFDEVGGDGFAIRGHWIPDYVNDICTHVVGTLVRRGRIARPDPALTLRRRMGACSGVTPATRSGNSAGLG
jgi:FMN-dependent oxidoreductase (nitrilotriacetate monooxygenase family)